MPNVFKIHVHPRPKHDRYDLHLPFYGLVYDKDSYAQRVLDNLPTATTPVVLTSNGEPNQRLELAAGELRKVLPKVTVENQPPCYETSESIFKDQICATLPKASRDYQDIIDFYLTNHKRIPMISQGPIFDFRGFEQHANYNWYHYGESMPVTQNQICDTLNHMLSPVFDDLVETLQNHLHIHKISYDVRSNLLIRLNHTKQSPPVVEGYRVPLHLDTSMLTIWIWTSEPGAVIYDQDCVVPVDDLHDQKQQYLIIPGLDYCELSHSMQSACWHGVLSGPETQDRVSMIAFLKSPVMR
jgi:hypothetical protein